jgi:single-stranded DNA-binding protein
VIIQTKTGVFVAGELTKDPDLRAAGPKQLMRLPVKISSEKDAAGNWQSLFVDVNLWHDLDQWDGMLAKGDKIAAWGRALRVREYPEGSGKKYYSLDADGVAPDGIVTLRWMQSLVTMIDELSAEVSQLEQLAGGCPAPALTPTDESTPFDPPPAPQASQSPEPQQTTLSEAVRSAPLYPGEQLPDYAPHVRQQDPIRQAADSGLIDDTADDLPF